MVRRREAKANLCGFEGARKRKRSGRERESVRRSRAAKDLDNPIFPVTIA